MEQLTKLQELDRKAPEQVKNLRAVTAGWGPDDGRWDALVAALDFACREHGHALAERIRNMERRNAWPERHGACGAVLPSQVADFIDPEVSK